MSPPSERPAPDATAPSGARATILVVDDDTANLASLVKIFEKLGLRVLPATTGTEALDLLRQSPVDIVLSDLMMPGMSGVELLKHARALTPEVEVVIMTAYGTIERAVEAVREGAYDFITKPFRRAQIERVVGGSVEKQALLAENRALRAQLADAQAGDRVRASSAMPRRCARSWRPLGRPHRVKATVLLMGESGTGKELFARRDPSDVEPVGRPLRRRQLRGAARVHHRGGTLRRGARRLHRRDEHPRGPFRPGAPWGTLFLDEVGELAPHVQVKLLRVLQSGEYERVGGAQSLRVDCRIVAATNLDLAAQGQGRRVPRRSLLPPERHRDHPAPPAGP
jgi:two-component system response regulator HydG